MLAVLLFLNLFGTPERRKFFLDEGGNLLLFVGQRIALPFARMDRNSFLSS